MSTWEKVDWVLPLRPAKAAARDGQFERDCINLEAE